MKHFKKIIAVTLVTYLLIELICFIFVKTKFKAAHFPTFNFQYNYKKYDFAIAEINPVWGTWHYKETYTEKKQCFESVYHINSFGARDKERSKSGDTNRIIFLGDSFIEGYGLNEPDRLSNQLEQLMGKEVLNFGCGYFTPTQEWLVYQNLAKDFTHNTVVMGMLPFNDFAEDDTSFHEQDKFIHYQPYLQGPDHELMYREDHLSKSTFNKKGYAVLQNTGKARLTRFLKEFTFWYNIFQFIKSNKPAIKDSGEPYSGYYDHTPAQLEKFKFILQKLKTEVKGKRVILLSIPVYNDFLRYEKKGPAPLTKELEIISKELGIGLIDLLPAFKQRVKDPKELYFSCDGHWNANANKMAAEIILPLLRK